MLKGVIIYSLNIKIIPYFHRVDKYKVIFFLSMGGQITFHGKKGSTSLIIIDQCVNIFVHITLKSSYFFK